jgi:uncharacterized repeat protein (TIGR02543 family)
VNSDAGFTNATDNLATVTQFALGYGSVNSASDGSNSSASESYDAGVIPVFKRISGLAWDDQNYNGIQDGIGSGGEPTIAGLTVNLHKYVSGSEVLVSGGPYLSTTTGANGTYVFINDTNATGTLPNTNITGPHGLDFGSDVTYRLEFVNPDTSAWTWTTPNAPSSTTANDSDALPFGSAGSDGGFARAWTVDLSAPNDTIDAGLYQVSAIYGKAWFDYNDNGIQDDNGIYSPYLIAGMAVNLYKDGATTPVATTTTAADGSYAFTRLASGSYVVEFDNMAVEAAYGSNWELEWTRPAATGSTAANDSDALPSGGDVDAQKASAAAIVVGTTATTAANIDAGIVPLLWISGFTWNEGPTSAANNGVLPASRNGLATDAGDTPRPGVTVQLYKNAASTPVATTTTNTNGAYLFAEDASSHGIPTSAALRILVNQTDTYRVGFTNADPENVSFTVAGTHHTATAQREPAYSAQNYYTKAYTVARNITQHQLNDFNGSFRPQAEQFNAGFYAIPSYTVTYQPNGGTASWGSGASTLLVKEGRLLSNQTVSRTGYTFNGWFLAPAETYAWNFAADLMPARDITLVAHWSLIPTYRVYYNANGGNDPVPTDGVSYYPGDTATVLGNPLPTRTGYTFLGWATTPGGTPSYQAGSTIRMTANDVWLYAQWQQDIRYTVTYFANGGTGSQADARSPYLPNTEVTVLGLGGIARTNYRFLGWSTAPGGPVVYQPGETFVITANVSLYAQWEPPTSAGGGGGEEGGNPPVPAGSPDPLGNQTGNLLFDLLNGNIPLGNFNFGGAWSLLNLILSLLALLSALVLFYTVIRRKRSEREYEEDENSTQVHLISSNGEEPEEEQELPRRRLRRLKIPALLVGLIPIILFFLLEDITLPIVWIDHWTPLIAVVFLIHVILVIVQFVVKRRIDDEDEDDEPRPQAVY